MLHRKFKGTVKTVTVSLPPSGKYFASVLVDTDLQELPAKDVEHNTALGIDLGIKSLAVCSDGRTFDNPKNLQHSLERLAMLQKRLSRKQKGSVNRNRMRIKVARLQEHIANCRKDNLHKITHALTHDNQVRTICMEDLNVKGMQRNHHRFKRGTNTQKPLTLIDKIGVSLSSNTSLKKSNTRMYLLNRLLYIIQCRYN